MRVAAVVPAHNEEETVETVLRALLLQTHRLERVAVVLDRCTDHTPEIVHRLAEEAADLISPVVKGKTSYELADFGPTYAETVNWGIRALSEVNYDVLLVVDADTVLGQTYVERGVGILREDGACAIAGSRLGGRNIRGSGSLIRRSFLEKATGGLYPEVPAPDTYLLYKALAMGYTVREVPDAEVNLLRPSFHWPSTWLRVKRHYRLGGACWWLGYHLLYLLGRSAKRALSDPLAGLAMCIGYFSSALRGRERSDVVEFVRRGQVEEMKAIVRNYLSPRMFSTRRAGG